MKALGPWLLISFLSLMLVGCNADNSSDDSSDNTSQQTDTTTDTGASDTDTADNTPAGDEPSGVRRSHAATEITGMAVPCGTGSSGCNLRVAGIHQLQDGRVKILSTYTRMVTGYNRREWHWIQLNSDLDGLDTDFADNGVKIIPGGDPDYYPSRGYAWDSQERLVLLSHPRNNVGNAQNAVVERYASNGEIDTTFGNSDQFLLPVPVGGTTGHRPTVLTVMSDDRVVIGGTEGHGFPTVRDWSLRILTVEGELDSEAHPTGEPIRYTIPDANNNTDLQGVFVFGDHAYLMGVGNTNQHMVMRVNTSDWSVDEDFGTDGIVSVITHASAYIIDLLVDSQGRVVVVGSGPGQSTNVLHAGSGWGYHIYRYTSAGLPDTSFGTDGLVKVDFGYSNVQTQTINDFAFKVYEQSNGKLLVIGHSTSTTGSPPPRGFSMARLLSNGALDTSFDPMAKRLQAQSIGSGYTHNSVANDRTQMAAMTLQDGSMIGVAAVRSGATSAVQKYETPLALHYWD